MPLRKNKNPPEQGRGRRQVSQGGSPNPAFSYYTSRPSEVSRPRAVARQEQTETGKGRRLPHLPFAQLPFWFLVIIFAVCVLKVLLLSTNPKVEVVGKSTISASYLQPSSVYISAAHKLLASSLTNRTKLTVNLDGTARALEQQFPELQTVSLAVPLVGNRPIVYLQVAQPSLVLQTGHGNFALNKAGIVLAKLHALPTGVPLVVDQSTSTPHPGKQYLPGSTVSFVQTVAYQLAAAHLTISTFVLPAGAPYELDVRLEGQPYVIRCNLEEDAAVQSGAAIAIVQSLGSNIPGSYVDVRTPGRAYYK